MIVITICALNIFVFVLVWITFFISIISINNTVVLFFFHLVQFL